MHYEYRLSSSKHWRLSGRNNADSYLSVPIKKTQSQTHTHTKTHTHTHTHTCQASHINIPTILRSLQNIYILYIKKDKQR